MTRQRLRPAYSPEELAQIYPKPHDHTQWIDHQMRVAITIQVSRAMADGYESACDLSCGDGTILRNVNATRALYGDFATGHQYRGPIEETIDQIPAVDLFVCTETLEHLDDPDMVLKKIRAKAGRLLLSTPVDAWGETNPEHYWAWSREDVEDMITDAGFKPVVYVALDLRPASADSYCFGIWGCL